MNREMNEEKSQKLTPTTELKIYNQNIAKAFLAKAKPIISWATIHRYDIICLTDSETASFKESGLPDHISTSWTMIGCAARVCILASKDFMKGRVVTAKKIFGKGERGLFVSLGPNLSICVMYQQQGIDSWPEDSAKLEMSAPAHSLYTEFFTAAHGFPNLVLCGDLNETTTPSDRFNHSRSSIKHHHHNRVVSRLVLEGYKDVASMGDAVLFDYPPTTGADWGPNPPPTGHFTMIQRTKVAKRISNASRIDQFWVKGNIIPVSLSISDPLVKTGCHMALTLSASFSDTRDPDWELQSPFSQPILRLAESSDKKKDSAAAAVMSSFARSPHLSLHSFVQICDEGSMSDILPLTEELLTTSFSSAQAVLGVRYNGIQQQDQNQSRALRKKVKKLTSLLSCTRHIHPDTGFHHPRLRISFFQHLDGPWANNLALCLEDHVDWEVWCLEVRRQLQEAKLLLCNLLTKGRGKNDRRARTVDDRFFRKLSKKRSDPIDHLIEEGKAVVGKEDLDGHITDYYGKIFSTGHAQHSSEPPPQPPWLASTTPDVPPGHNRELMPDRSLTCDDVELALRCGNDSAPGLDRLSGSFWRMVLLSLDKDEDKTQRDIYLEMITALFNAWLRLGDIPCKLMEVLLIRKKHNKGITLSNLRPITLQCSLLKIFKGILCLHVAQFVDPLLNQSQSGARKGHSCQKPVMKFVERLTSAKANSKPTHSLLIDLRKAFDLVPHWALRRALKRLSLPGWMVNLLMNSLHGTAVVFRTRWGHSPQVSIERGIPQGDPLSALLFIIFLDSLLVSLQQEDLLYPGLSDDARASLILAYMDDLTLSADSNAQLQHLARVVERWCQAMGMLIAPEKSVYMVTGKSKNRDIYTPPLPEPSLVLAGLVLHPIPSDTPFRLLGLWMTSDLDFSKHHAKLDTQVSLACHTALAHHLSPAETSHWFSTYLYSRLRWAFAIIPFPLSMLRKWDLRTTRVLRKTTTFVSVLNHSPLALHDPPRLMSSGATHSAFDLQSIRSLYTVTYGGETYIRLDDPNSNFADQCYETKASQFRRGITSLKVLGLAISKSKRQGARETAIRRVREALICQISPIASVRHKALAPVAGGGAPTYLH